MVVAPNPVLVSHGRAVQVAKARNDMAKTIAAPQEDAMMKATQDTAVQTKATKNKELSAAYATIKELKDALERAELERDIQVKTSQDRTVQLKTTAEQLQAKQEKELSSM